MLKWMNQNGTAIGTLLAAAPLIWTTTSYFIESAKQKKQEQFENYHSVITDMATGGRKDAGASQRALIFELRNFPEYREITCREIKTFGKAIKTPETRVELELTAGHLACPDA